MKSGIQLPLPARPLLGARRTFYLHSLPYRARPAHASSPFCSTPSFLYPPSSSSFPGLTMFRKAADDYKAKAPSTAPSNPSRHMFPSSSPSPQDGNIADSFKRGRVSTASGAGFGSKTGNFAPLYSTSPNIVTNPPPFKRGTTGSSITGFASGNSVASLCNNAGSFTDESTTSSQTKTVASVMVNYDDFSSDDDGLELDYQCPASLPPPPAAKPAARPVPATIDLTGTSDVSQAVPPTSQIPWSSSPQEHRFPPTFHQRPAKRDSPDQGLAALPKKRKLPTSFRPPKVEASYEKPSSGRLQSHPSDLTSTPAPKAKSGVPWDMTLSATKEQRRQLKNQTKKPETSDNATLEAETRQITQHHIAQKAKNSAISLSQEQTHVIDIVMKKKQSVFFTGPAGTGKSVLMRAIIAELRKKWSSNPERLSVTASTGLAACNIGGMTLHSFAGIGLGKEDVPTLVKKIRRNAKAKNRWLRTSVLVIDEVSMVDGDLFDKLAQIARTIRNNGRPWGGIQLVITGDFFQLPPVPDGDKKRDVKFSFEAATWNTSIDHTIGLTQVFRQRDSEFADMLNEMRLGNISDQTVQTFKALSRPLNFDDDLDVTELFPTRFEVEKSNESRLRALGGQVYHYESHDTSDQKVDQNTRDRLLQHMMAPKGLDLKKGAQVMLIKNMDDTLVNGSLGRIVGFMNESTFEMWGEREYEKEDGADEESTGSKKIKSYNRDAGASATKDLKEYPVVKFSATDGSHRTLLCVPEDWKVETPTGEVQAARKQLPLILAWALSIHKAQGQTLERVKVDLGKVFEKGQAYVALSRATSKHGLQVLRFEKSKVMAHPRVVSFYNKLYSAESAAAPKKQKPATISEFAHKPKSSSLVASKKVAQGRVTNLDDDEEAMAAAYA